MQTWTYITVLVYSVNKEQNLVYIKTLDSVSCTLWLAIQTLDIQCYSLIHL